MKLLIAILTAILFTSCSLFEQDFEQDYVRLQTNNQTIIIAGSIPSVVKDGDTIIVHRDISEIYDNYYYSYTAINFLSSDTSINLIHYYKAVVISN